VGPRANEARSEILQLCELDLQLAFVTARALREDIEDQAGSVDDTSVKRTLKIALLRRRKRVVEDDDVDVVRLAREAQLLGLTAADEHGGIGTGTATGEGDSWMGTRALREQAEFFETGFEIDLTEVDADKRCVDQIGGCQNEAAGLCRLRTTLDRPRREVRMIRNPGGNSPDGQARQSR
jgi:hypothetical protein